MNQHARISPPTLPRRRLTARRYVCVVPIALALAATENSHGQFITLADSNSVVQMDASSPSGVYRWNVQGWNQLQEQSFWSGIGDGPVAPLSVISRPSIIQPSAREVIVNYTLAGGYSVSVDHFLTGGAPVSIGPAYDIGHAYSEMEETVTVMNLSGATLPFHLYEYSHFDISSGGYDTAVLNRGQDGLYSGATQTYLSFYGVWDMARTGAQHGEVAVVGTTLAKLTSGGPVTLGPPYFDGPIGPGDLTWALQWDLDIPAGGSRIVNNSQFIDDVRNVPEPSVGALILAAWLARSVVVRRETNANRL